MSALKASALLALRSGLAAGLNAQTLTYQTRNGSELNTAVSFQAIVTENTITHEHDEQTGTRSKVRRIAVRPLATLAATLRMGDVINYAALAFVIVAISGEDVLRYVCEDKDDLGTQRNNRFRAEGA